MEEYLNKVGIDLSVEENKPHDIEESIAPIKKEKINGDNFLNDINESFDESKRAPTDAEIKFLNISMKNLNEDLLAVIASENYEQAAVIRDKIAEHTKRLNFN